MDLSLLNDASTLPFSTLTAAAIWRLLGPTAEYLGGKGQELTEIGVNNLERVFTHAIARLPADAPQDGAVPPRVLRLAVTEGAFTEDEVAAAYLGGVLASSKVAGGRDDRGVSINATISRLSTFQLRLHYVTYMALHYLLQGVESDFGSTGAIKNHMHFGTTGLLVAMGMLDEFNDPDFNVDGVLSHALYGLSKEELIGDWMFQWDKGLSCSPTPIGTELFLWANGQGRRSIEYFFDREFEPIDVPDDDITLLPGREIDISLDDGEVVIAKGFDYARKRRQGLHFCKIAQ